MNYNDATLHYFDASVDDEYERSMLHRSSTISMYLMIWFTFTVGAVLAWVLPGLLSLWSVVVFLPPLLANLLGEHWLKQHTPRPNYPELPRRDWAIGIPIAAIWMAGVTYNAFDTTVIAIVAMVAGGILGGFLASRSIMKHNARNRQKDTERLNAELDD